MQTLERIRTDNDRVCSRPEAARWPLDDRHRLTVHGTSETGSVRSTNEDAFLIADLAPTPSDLHDHATPLLAVADGAGGNPGGARASALVLETALREAQRRGTAGAWARRQRSSAVERSLEGVVEACQSAVVQDGASHPAFARMATTLTIALLRDRILQIAHVGDSRCYLVRGHECILLTTDHTMAHVLEREGILPRSATGMLRHVLANAIAANHEAVSVEQRTLQLCPGDTLVLCSDGVSNALADDAIAEIVAAAPSMAAAAHDLVRHAVATDGSDNATAVVAQVEPRDH